MRSLTHIKLIPEYKPGYKYNITLPTDLLERASFSFYRLQVLLPDGELKSKRLKPDEFLTITSFANIKIRTRMLHLYAEAERRSLLVAGTTNRTEFILGDFCKYGDGGTDIEPFTHLYKNQIYQLSDHLEVLPEIIDRQPSPDTFSLPGSMKFPQMRQLKYWIFLKMQLQEHIMILLQNIVLLLIYGKLQKHWNNNVAHQILSLVPRC